MGAGGGAIGVGLVAVLLANSKQDEIDRAPTSSVEELDHLVELESSARWRYRAANVFLIGGAITVGVGVGLAIVDMRRGRARRIEVTPVALEGGAGVLVTIGPGAP
jgi:hypothetical protein